MNFETDFAKYNEELVATFTNEQLLSAFAFCSMSFALLDSNTQKERQANEATELCRKELSTRLGQ